MAEDSLFAEPQNDARVDRHKAVLVAGATVGFHPPLHQPDQPWQDSHAREVVDLDVHLKIRFESADVLLQSCLHATHCSQSLSCSEASSLAEHGAFTPAFLISAISQSTMEVMAGSSHAS